MDAQSFWQDFIRAIQKNRTVLENCWNDKTEFTAAMKELITKVIRAKKPSEQYVIQPEYFNIDLVEWEQKKLAAKEYLFVPEESTSFRLEKYAWNLDIAVEHENEKQLWMDEVVKLAHIFAKLRVVIGYLPRRENQERTWQLQKAYLNAVADTVSTLHCCDNMDHGDFLVILGDVDGNEATAFEKLAYTPYLYKKGEKGEFVRQCW